MDSTRVSGEGMAFFQSDASVWIALLALCVSVTVSAAPPPAPVAPAVDRAAQLYASVTPNTTEDYVKLAEGLLKIYEDPGATPTEKSSALHRRMLVLFIDATRFRKPEGIAQAEECYARYNAACRGRDRTSDSAVSALYCEMMVSQLKAGRKERLDDLLKAVDGISTLPGSSYYTDELRDKLRTLGYFAVGDCGKGEPLLQTFLKPGRTLTYDLATTASDAYCAAERKADALNVLIEALRQNAASARYAEMLGEKIAVVAPQAGLDEGKLLVTLTQVVTYPKAVKPILNMLIARRTEAGDAVGALAYAKLYYDLAPLDEIEGAIEVVSRCMRTVDMDVVRTNQFLEFQKFGPGGPDGKAAGKEALVNPLAGVKSPLPPETLKALGDLAAKTVPAGERVYEPLRDRGTLALALGRPEEALALYRAAYSAASIGQVKEVSALAPRALKAIDGGVWRVNLYLKYQKCGPAGEDGTAGNADDLTDPLAQEKLAALPEDVTRALGTVAAKGGGAMNLCEARGYAFLAMGQYGKGFNQMRAAFAAASSDPKMLARGIEDVASAIKAYDGHVHRANQYLLYQKQNGKTPDGKAMENPLPVIMAEIGVAR